MAEVPAYEAYVRQSADRILQEASEFFMQRGSVYEALRDLAQRLDESGIPYAVLGAIALGQHGMPRMTLDLDVLLTPEGLQEFKARYLGRGYVPALPRGGAGIPACPAAQAGKPAPLQNGAEKTFRAGDTGVRIEVITTGEYPGDGLPKPVRFPHPREASVEIGGIRVITLERLIQLKLASGMTAAHRLRDLADVQDLIRLLPLPAEFADRLDDSVRPLYQKLWSQAQTPDRLQET